MHEERATAHPNGLSMSGFLAQLNRVVGQLDCDTASRPPGGFSCSLLNVPLGPLDVLQYDGPLLHSGQRHPHHIRDSWVDNFIAVLPLTAPLGVTQGGLSSVTPPGATVLLSSSQPFDCRFLAPNDHTYSQWMVRIPGRLLRQHIPHIDDCCATPIDLRTGAGKILRSLVEHLVEDRQAYSASQAERFGPLLLGTYATMAIEAPEWRLLQHGGRATTHTQVLMQARAYIASHLTDPNLCPSQVAEHCHVSLRHLYTVFAAASLGVAQHIRDARLQSCRDALRQADWLGQSILDIALHWGFGSLSSFNRAYRQTYGITPSQERAAANCRQPRH